MAIGFLAATAWPASPLAAATLFVDGNQPGCNDVKGQPFCTVQAALDASAHDDVVEVAAGLYSEALQIPNRVEIRGAGPELTTILGSAPSPVISNPSGFDLVLEELKITGGNHSSWGGGITHVSDRHYGAKAGSP